MALFVADTPTRLASFTQSQTIRGLAAALAPGTAMHSAVLLAVLAIGSVLLTWVLARPALMAPVWERALATDDGSADAAQALARQAFRRAIGRALAWLGAAGVATIMAGEAGLAITSVALVALGCVGVDIVAELRFRRVHAAGGMAIGWPMHRLYAVGPVLARLARAGIPAFPRGLRDRTLLSFWGPYVPIEILVPPARASEARALAGDGLVFDADASRGSPHPPSPARG
jgi:hypothetical protein